jgi:UDP-N-acetyl-D-mannosaminuronic acid transferase (WecB/TagA/CpsF family)
MERYRAEIDSLRRVAGAAKQKANAAAASLQRDAVAVVAAAAYGAMRKNDTIPETIGGIDADIVAIGVLYAVGQLASGTAADVAHDASVGIAAGIAYNRARS